MLKVPERFPARRLMATMKAPAALRRANKQRREEGMERLGLPRFGPRIGSLKCLTSLILSFLSSTRVIARLEENKSNTASSGERAVDEGDARSVSGFRAALE